MSGEDYVREYIVSNEYGDLISSYVPIYDESGKVVAASFWGKLKTVSQMVAIIAAIILLLPVFPQEMAGLITNILVWLSAVITVISGADYVIGNFDVFKQAK